MAAGRQTTQGLGVVLAGALASLFAPSTSVVLCGAAGALCAVFLGLARRQQVEPRSRPAGSEAG